MWQCVLNDVSNCGSLEVLKCGNVFSLEMWQWDNAEREILAQKNSPNPFPFKNIQLHNRLCDLIRVHKNEKNNLADI